MKSDFYLWFSAIERLQKGIKRKKAASLGLQWVHVEILEYLSQSNRYSNTAKHVGDALGQTRGTLSKSLQWLRVHGFIERKAHASDGRIKHLLLTEQGIRLLETLQSALPPPPNNHERLTSELASALGYWQKLGEAQGFGVCNSCVHHETRDHVEFKCCLTGEVLKTSEGSKICAEHKFPD